MQPPIRVRLSPDQWAELDRLQGARLVDQRLYRRLEMVHDIEAPELPVRRLR